MRHRQFNFRLNDEEHAQMLALANHYGCTGAAVVLRLLAEDFKRVGASMRGTIGASCVDDPQKAKRPTP